MTTPETAVTWAAMNPPVVVSHEPWKRAAAAGVAALAMAWSSVALAQEAPPPEGATGFTTRDPVTAESYMVSAANPAASRAGAEILAAGGSAVDALIAVQLVLNLVEPQSSGLGGGAFLLAYDAATGQVDAYDGREKAPMEADETLFLDDEGEPLPFWDAVVGGRSVGVPGLLRMMEMAHADHGKLPWADLFEPAITMATEGFAITPRLHELVAADEHLSRYNTARAYFYDDRGEARPIGEILTNPLYAGLLRDIASEGADAFYGGTIALDIVQAVRNVPDNPGLLSLDDMADYQAVKRTVLCAPYRDLSVCGMPPPTSGGIATLQMLGILDHFDLASLDPLSAEAAHLLAEAGRLAFADRGLYVADADFVDVPVDGLIDPAYLMSRAQLIDPAKSMGPAEAGTPPEQHGWLYLPGESFELPSTSHISIVDSDGNAVSMTTSIESGFGSRVMVHGILLNNQLTDFSFRPEGADGPVANRVEPGKRPRSSMSPTMIFDADGDLLAVTGSPGGSRIIGYVVQSVVAMVDWGMDPQAAVTLPHIVNRNGGTDLEAGTAAADLEAALVGMGHEVNVRDLNSGLHAIMVTEDGLIGGADPRREGLVVGE